MHKSLFTKYFAICAAVIIISLTLLGAIMMLVAAQYFKTEKYDMLKQNTENAVTLTLENYTITDNQVTLQSSVYRTYAILANAIDAQLFLVDASGKVIYSPPYLESGEADSSQQVLIQVGPYTGYSIPQKVLDKVDSGEYFDVGNLGGIFDAQNYTYALPIRLEDGRLMGYLFLSTPANAMAEFLMQVLQMFCISSVFVIFLSFIVFYFVTLQMVKPLRRMAFAAKKFGSGDFSERLEVRGEDEIAQLALALNNMAQSLSVLDSSRRSFVGNVSHELRTPMTTISGFVDGILDGTIPKEKEREYLTTVSNEVKRLSRLVRAMLNMSKIESGEVKINPANFDVLDVILQTLFSFESTIEQKRVDVEGLDRDKVIVEADKDLIHQVVYNLIENAVKFVNQGGTISFHFRSEAGRTYIRIRNSGAGLSKDEVQHVFERFYKSDKSRSLDTNGVGLGLYIVHSIIALHGGEIVVRSVEGEYTEFEFYVPTGKMSKALKKSAN
ncbi:MAG: sensor histidine kinase [Oscillospiraceae bacterium]|jgi:signal transduction histidine kinase